MPDLAQRDRLESEFRERLAEAQRRLRESLSPGNEQQAIIQAEEDRRNLLYWAYLLGFLFSYNQLHSEIGAPTLPTSLPARDELLSGQLGRRGLELPPHDLQELNEGSTWASENAERTARLMRQSDERALERMTQAPTQAPSQPTTPDIQNRQYQDFADDVASDDRVERVAVTESTRSISGGEHALARRVSFELGWVFERFWRVETNELDKPDERVCPVCRPFHKKPSAFYGPIVGAPPAHPICRCYEVYRVVSFGDDPIPSDVGADTPLPGDLVTIA